MRRCGWVAAAIIASPLGAQAPMITDRAFAEAAVVVMGYDHFAGSCTAGNAFTASEAAAVATWQREHEVELVRAHIVVLERDPRLRQTLSQARTALVQRFTGLEGRKACEAAMALIAQPDAQLARKSPELLRTLRAQGAPPVVAGATTPPAATSPASQPPASRRAGATVDPALLRSINAFGFDTRPEMGMGGFIGIKVYPVVLFRDGSALTDIAGLAFAGGVDAHRRAHADDWVRWRTQGGEIQLLKDGKWDKLEFQKTYSTLPRDFRLNGRFRRSSGTGNIAVGGTQSVTVVSTYLFSPDGRVVRDVAVGSTASAGDIAVATSQAGPDRRGRYTIDGITLLIRYDDGTEERRLLVTDPADPKSVIWLDGDSYVRR